MENTPTPPKQGVRARERNALERISNLETDLNAVAQSAQMAIQQILQRLNTVQENLETLVAATIGAEALAERVQKAREDRAVEQAKRAKDALDNALIEGQVVPAEKIGQQSLITGYEADKDGNTKVPGYVQLGFSGILPEFQEKMLGQGVGFEFEIADGGKFVVTGVFDIVPPATEEAAPAQDVPAAEQVVDVTPQQ